MSNKTSKLPPPPKSTVDETGRRIFEGSISQMTSLLSEAQKAKGLKLLGSAARTPTELVEALGMNAYSPHSSEAIRRWIAELEKDGHVVAARDDRGKLLGWKTPDEEPEK